MSHDLNGRNRPLAQYKNVYFRATIVYDTSFNIPVPKQEYVAMLNYLFQAIMYTIIGGTLADLVQSIRKLLDQDSLFNALYSLSLGRRGRDRMVVEAYNYPCNQYL